MAKQADSDDGHQGASGERARKQVERRATIDDLRQGESPKRTRRKWRGGIGHDCGRQRTNIEANALRERRKEAENGENSSHNYAEDFGAETNTRDFFRLGFLSLKSCVVQGNSRIPTLEYKWGNLPRFFSVTREFPLGFHSSFGSTSLVRRRPKRV